MLKKIAIVIITVVIIILSVSGYMFYYEDKDNSEYKNERYYTQRYSIEINTRKNYTINLPVPISSSGKPLELINNLIFKNGSALFKIIDTDYGKAIEIIGNGNVSIFAERNENINAILSLYETNNNSHGILGNWIYCNMTDKIIISVELYETFPNGFDRTWIEKYEMKQGWQLIKFESLAGSE